MTRDQDGHKGAVEGTGKDPIVPITPHGANLDDSEVSNADEKGHTTDHPRDEQGPTSSGERSSVTRRARTLPTHSR
jgi:hypothetical protein